MIPEQNRGYLRLPKTPPGSAVTVTECLPQERCWGLMTVMDEFGTRLFEAYLPVAHRILATRHDPDRACCEHIVEGPDMPIHAAGKPIERIDLLFYVDDSGQTYGYWGHKMEKRWLISASPATIGD